ncbi:MAG: DUF2130 domain-containing protein [Chitinophagaceae bacterium]|nr:DUF2130 domain-containing protein [Chitinophagaceae bacterium]
MPTTIKCPRCTNEFDIEEVLYSEIQGKLEKENQEKLNQSLESVIEEKKKLSEDKKEFEEKKKKENELFQQKIAQEKIKIHEEEKKNLIKENETYIKALEEKANNAEIENKRLKEKELENLRLQNQLEEIKRNAETEKKKYLLENSSKIIEDALKNEREGFALEKKEWEIKQDQQSKLIDDLKRKNEQGSMQLQGEAQELLLEEILQNTFPYDLVGEVPKGKKGADCLLHVRNKFGVDCGKILFESKRTANWSKDWIEKLKQDKINSGADIAVLISQALPDKMEDEFEFKDEIWICSFRIAKILAASLREGIIKTSAAIKSQEGKGDKVQMLYDYMTSSEFASQWRAVREVFKNMKQSIEDERRAMEKLWKNREKQLDKALLNSDHIIGSIEGIAGKNSIDLNLLENNTEEE